MSYEFLLIYVLIITFSVHSRRVGTSQTNVSGSGASATAISAEQPTLCRMNLKVKFPLGSWYDMFTCGLCYGYMSPHMFKPDVQRMIHNGGALYNYNIDVNGSIEYLSYYKPDPFNRSSPIFDTFIDDRATEKWQKCCKAAIDCCNEMDSVPPLLPENDEDLYCPRTWDGWSCLPDTKAGETINFVCPEYVYFSATPPGCPRYALKECTENGTWFIGPDNKEWTDYNPCAVTDDLLERIYVHMVAYGVTIFAVVPAIILFSLYKQLQVTRIKLHKNLFMSLLANAICVLAFKSVLINYVNNSEDSMITNNTIACKLLLILTRYFRSTNYMWMFCEGFYLHKLIAAAFAEQKSILPFYIIGWGVPVVVVAVYSIVRSTMYDSLCWMVPVDPYEWIINGPNLLTILVNAVFLANILRVLWSKLRARHSNEPSQFRKAVKATLVLIPLFGAHFLLILYRPQTGGNCIWTKIHFYAHYLVDGLQGSLVALIYCYMNSEVQDKVKRTYNRKIERYEIRNHKSVKSRALSYTTNYTTVAESVNQGTSYKKEKNDDGNEEKSADMESRL